MPEWPIYVYMAADSVRLVPLPHPSGVSRWLNTPAHQVLLARALALLAGWRAELSR